ncbi:MAG: sigma-70 family RNA polymerase sigma factor [Fimbriimonadales bacterium]|nr:sigma-70 family RNA polymerase sigma factor [Fimbriimonadales bacterium]
MVCWNGGDVSELIGRAQAGDQAAAEHLLQLYRPLVMGVARHFFLPGSEPEDVQQIGMIGLWKAILRYNPARCASFAAFARLCIRRQILSALKRATHPSVPTVAFPEPSEQRRDWREWVYDPTPSLLEQLMEQEEASSALDTLMGQLSPLEARVFALYGRGQSYREIAEQVGCSPKAVDNALVRIKRKAMHLQMGK